MMTPRQKQILTLVINEYIDTGIPVSSKGLVKKYKLLFSPATLRAELAILCEEGYLYQPHTSAGRMPTDAGYRFYIKHAMKPTTLSLREKVAIQKELRRDKEIPGRSIAKAISLGTQNLGMHFDPEENVVYKEGLIEVFRNPALKEVEEITDFIEFFETLNDHISRIFDTVWEDDYNIFVGRERFFPSLEDFSMLYSDYTLRGREYVIGAIGPKRMNYAKNISVLDFIRNEVLNSNINEL